MAPRWGKPKQPAPQDHLHCLDPTWSAKSNQDGSEAIQNGCQQTDLGHVWAAPSQRPAKEAADNIFLTPSPQGLTTGSLHSTFNPYTMAVMPPLEVTKTSILI